MSLGLLWPAGLAALAGLLLPLLIHLVRRVETRQTEFAALRWLTAQASPRRRLRFEERVLLGLRLLLIALLALLLARPVLIGAGSKRPWIVVAPGVAAADLPDPALAGTAELRWLAPGFPPLEFESPAKDGRSFAEGHAFASLLRELDASLPAGTALTAIVPEEITGLDGERIVLSRNIDWRVVHGNAPEPEAAAAAPPLRIAIRYAPGREPELRYLRAAVSSFPPFDKLRTGRASPERESSAFAGMTVTEEALTGEGEVAAATEPPIDAHWLIWLASAPWPPAVEEWIAAGGAVLLASSENGAVPAGAAVVWRGAQTGVELRAWAHGRGRVLALPAALTPAALPELLDPQFPMILRGWLAPAPPAPARAFAAGHRPLTGAAAASAPARPLQPWLAGAIALLFLIERWLAADPRRGRAA